MGGLKLVEVSYACKLFIYGNEVYDY